MPGGRQFAQLRKSRASTSSILQRCNTEKNPLLCVTCVNRSLSKQKQIKKEQANELNYSLRQSIELQEQLIGQRQAKARQKKMQEERRIMTQYNQEAARIRSASKEHYNTRKQEQKQQIEAQIKRQKQQKEASSKREKLLKEHWLSTLQGQIKEHQKIKQQNKYQRLNTEPEKCLFQLRKNQRNKEQQIIYQQELREQIAAAQSRKQQSRHHSKELDIRSIPLLDQAEKRQLLVKENLVQRQKELLQEARKRQDKLKQAKKYRQDKNTREQIENQNRWHQEDLLKDRKRALWNQQKQVYIQGLKQQINFQEAVKLQERQQRLCERQEPFSTISRKVSTMNCDGCDKEVAKMYLTRFKENA